MEHRFQSSRLTRGNVVFPTVLVVNDRHVTRIKASFAGQVEESISLRQVSSVTVNLGMVFADVTVHSSGGTDPLRSHGHSIADARRVKEVIEELQANLLTAGVADLSGLRACPRCAETIKVAALVCKHCGGDVPIELTEEAPPEPGAAHAVAAAAAKDTDDWSWS